VTNMLNREQAMFRAFDFIFRSGTEGDFYEFGVYEGFSLINALKAEQKIKLQKKCNTKRYKWGDYFVFDSFAGLPSLSDEDKLEGYDIFKAGQYSCPKEKVVEKICHAGFNPEKIVFVKGFYEHSLNLKETKGTMEDSKAAVIHIDCDLYSSAKLCLEFVTHRMVDGAVVLFDDWFCYRGRSDKGVRRAFDDWLRMSGWMETEYFRYSWAGMCFILNTVSPK